MTDRRHVPHRAAPLATLIAAMLVGGASLPAQAQALPNAGSLLQQVQPALPTAPARPTPGLKLESPADSALPPSTPFAVKTVRLVGNTRFDTETLHALVADAEDRTLMLPELGALARRITRYYQDHGQPLARAIVPPQTIEAGVVTIQIIEARYGRIALDNSAPVRTPLVQSLLGALQPGELIEQAGLDRTLLLLSDIPGLQLVATMRPGADIGSADLLVNATPAATTVLGDVAVDTFGSRYTGRLRLGASVSLPEPLQQGDVLSVGAMSSGHGMDYGRLGYDLLVGGQGTRLGASVSSLRYALGGAESALGAHGTAQVTGLSVAQPLLRGRTLNLSARVALDAMQLDDRVDAGAIRTDRRLRALTLALGGDFHAGGSYSLAWQGGRVAFTDDAASQADAATAGTQGAFAKWNASAGWQQPLAAGWVSLSTSVQWARDNLDPSMKMGAAGAGAVRAYDTGALSGDSGWLATAEYRQGLMALGSGQLSGMVFADVAHLRVNRRPWTAGANTATLAGAGIGMQWSQAGPWSARAYVAAPMGGQPELVAGSRSTRAAAEIRLAF